MKDFLSTILVLLLAAPACAQWPMFGASSVVENGEVTTGKLDSDSVITSKLLDGAVTTTKLASSYDSLYRVSGGTMWASDGGAIGIGTTAPMEDFHISGGDLLLDNDYKVKFKDAAGTSRFFLTLSNADVLEIYNNSGGNGGPITFGPKTGGVEAARFTADGRLGIGTISPVTALQIDEGAATTSKITIGDAASAACLMLGDTDEAGCTECTALDGTLTCTTDADCVCDGG